MHLKRGHQMLKVDTVRVGGSGCPPARDMRVVCIGLVCCPCCKSADSALLDDVLRNPQLIVRGVKGKMLPTYWCAACSPRMPTRILGNRQRAPTLPSFHTSPKVCVYHVDLCGRGREINPPKEMRACNKLEAHRLLTEANASGIGARTKAASTDGIACRNMCRNPTMIRAMPCILISQSRSLAPFNPARPSCSIRKISCRSPRYCPTQLPQLELQAAAAGRRRLKSKLTPGSP
jgi:hypothetical protein